MLYLRSIDRIQQSSVNHIHLLYDFCGNDQGWTIFQAMSLMVHCWAI